MPVSDLHLALDVLVRDGLSREEASLALLNDPQLPDRIAPRIAARRAEVKAEIEADAAARAAATPEGRRLAAEQALKAREQRAKMIEGARALVAAESGLSADDVAALGERELLHAAGIERQPELMNVQERDAAAIALAEQWHTLPEAERLAKARELGVSKQAAEMHRVAAGIDTPRSEGEGQ